MKRVGAGRTRLAGPRRKSRKGLLNVNVFFCVVALSDARA